MAKAVSSTCMSELCVGYRVHVDVTCVNIIIPGVKRKDKNKKQRKRAAART